jgi:hypothetical protein
MERAYLETSVVSYLVARRSPDLLVAARQQLTIDWWQKERGRFDLYASDVVIQEASAGDAGEITKRLTALADVPLQDISNEAIRLADLLLKRGIVPPKAGRDALHISVATYHQMDFLLSWNCKHIANAHVRKMVDRVFRAEGYESPEICTPEELGEIL